MAVIAHNYCYFLSCIQQCSHFRERQEGYSLIKFSIEEMCKVLKVSKSDYDFWLQSGPSRLWLENQKISSLTPYLRLVFKAIALQG